MSPPFTLLQHASAVYCPEKSDHRNVLLAGLSHAGSSLLHGTYLERMLPFTSGQTIVNVLNDSDATRVACCLPGYVDTLDAKGCLITPGTDSTILFKEKALQMQN